MAPQGPPGSAGLWVEEQGSVFVAGTAGLSVGFLLSRPHSYKLSICLKAALVHGPPRAAQDFLGVGDASCRGSHAEANVTYSAGTSPLWLPFPGKLFALKLFFANKMLCGFSLQEKSVKP